MTDLRRSIPVRLGVEESGRPVVVDLAADSSHLAVQGQTRSGKSVFNYQMLGAIATNEAVRVTGFDLSGLLLGPLAERGEERVALGPSGLSGVPVVLDWANGLVEERTEFLRASRRDKFAEFSAERPLVLVVAEEFDATLEAAADLDAAEGRKPGDRIEPQIRRGVRRLAALSAKAGVRLVLTTQRAEANVLGGASRSNFGTRITFRVDNPDSVRMLHPSADQATCERVESFAPGIGLLDRPGHPRTTFRGPDVAYADYCARILGPTA